jgi:PAS domain S-box-containing protein
VSPSNKIFDPEFLDKLPIGIIITRRIRSEGIQIVFTNKKFQNDYKLLVGKIDDQILNIDFLLSYFEPVDLNRIQDILNSEAAIPTISEWKFKLPSGETTWVQFRVTKLDDEHNLIIIRNIGMLMQVTAEKDATKAQYEALIEKAPNFMFIYKDGIVEYFNQAFTEKLGYTHEELNQRRDMPTFLVAPEYRKEVATFLLETRRELMKGKITEELHDQYKSPEITTELELVSKDGTRIPVYAIIRKIYSKKSSIVQGVLVDLSEIKKIQETKFDFLTLSQHFLRTPIANLKGYLDLYKSQIQKDISIKEKESLEKKYLEIFERNVNRLISLVKDLNDISLIRSGKLKCHLRGEDFIPILQQIIGELEYLLRRYRIDLIVEYPPIPYVVSLDRDRISQALRNVLVNAITFTGHGTINITLSTQNNETLVLKVEDTGVGINPEVLEDVGKPFMTFHSSSSGLGLGLYLTKEIIKDHNGTLEIQSEGFHKGTQVTITLPLLIPLVPISTIIDSVTKESKSDLDSLIKIATTSESILARLDAVKRIGSYSGPQKEKALSALEKCILYDKDKTIRNLSSKLYTQLAENIEEDIIKNL